MLRRPLDFFDYLSQFVKYFFFCIFSVYELEFYKSSLNMRSQPSISSSNSLSRKSDFFLGAVVPLPPVVDEKAQPRITTIIIQIPTIHIYRIVELLVTFVKTAISFIEPILAPYFLVEQLDEYILWLHSGNGIYLSSGMEIISLFLFSRYSNVQDSNQG